jgi:hypothetical protein
MNVLANKVDFYIYIINFFFISILILIFFLLKKNKYTSFLNKFLFASLLICVILVDTQISSFHNFISSQIFFLLIILNIFLLTISDVRKK